MRHLQVEQGSREWLLARLGIPTASNFDRIITPKKMEPVKSEASNKFIAELIAERSAHLMFGEDMDAIERQLKRTVKTEAMTYGNTMEPVAVTRYEFHEEVDTSLAGIIFNDEGTAAASLDRFVGEDGGAEIKCPFVYSVYVERTLWPSPNEFRPQVQGQLWISGRKWIDVCCYYPGKDILIQRVFRDEEFIAKLAEYHAEFNSRLETKWSEFQNSGNLTNPTP